MGPVCDDCLGKEKNVFGAETFLVGTMYGKKTNQDQSLDLRSRSCVGTCIPSVETVKVITFSGGKSSDRDFRLIDGQVHVR